MPALLVSPKIASEYADAIAAAWPGIELVVLPEDPAERLPPEALERIDFAYFSGDIYSVYSRSFFAAAQGAPNLRWLHTFNAGVDNPVFQRFLDRGVRLSTSSGSTAQPIAQSVIGGMLLLARPFLHWLDAQRRRAWEPVGGEATPPDLAGQRMTVVGLGAIGSEVARLARAFGLEVVGVRRSPRREGDPVDVVVPPSQLADLAARTDWLVLACPLTPETRGLISRDVLRALKPGAFVLNVARGEVADEAALIEALRDGHLGGAYLDVFATEPLPPESPLWDLPNVIISPHNSAAAQGNERRATEGYFLPNLRRMARGEPLVNAVSVAGAGNAEGRRQ
ncbi:D-2-hydroxyacid dehydrogenase [Tepidiforma sp.]|uniref:D-2-hydroxyacid dehydrogenase n=1 Tax=Tepidiforma sp. TaxID=2682230 RepID=UPI002ADDEF7A|nr:D-2-hydroxyacid dehydrogenase [Tepidiforma sp.]